MEGGAILRPMAPEDLDAAFTLGRAGGLHGHLDDAAWRERADWAIRDNPFRCERPVGHVLERNGEWLGVMYYVYVPFRLGAWRGVAPMLNGLATKPEAGPIAGLRLHHEFLATPTFEVMLVPHVNEFGAAVLARKGGVAALGSEISVTGCLSPGRRVAASLARMLRLPAGPVMAVLAPVLEPGLAVAGFRRMALPRLHLAAEDPFDLVRGEDGALDDLAERALAGLDAGVIRNARFLRWRYAASPSAARTHAVALRGGDGRLAALAVLEAGPMRDFRVMDLIFDPAVPGADRDILAAALASARARGGRMLYARQGQPILADLWRTAGAALAARPTAQFWLAAKRSIALPDPLRAEYSHGDHKIF